MMFGRDTYITRRERLKKTVKEGLLLFLGNDESSINYGNNYYPFRQDSSFLYFFGIDRPGLIAVIDADNDMEYVFGEKATLEDVVWTGAQESLESLTSRAGISSLKPLAAFEQVIGNAVSKKQKIHFLPPYRPEHVLKLSAWLGMTSAMLNSRISTDFIKAIVAQRSVKSPEEVAEIEKAVDITIDMQIAAMQQAKEGLTETWLAGVLNGIAVSAGGNLSFPPILSVNGQSLHIHYSSNKLRDGQMVLCDCGAENALHYAGDLTRTFPVNKKFTTRQKEIYDIVLAAEEAAINAFRPGILHRDIHLLACEKLVEGLQQIGLMKGGIQEAVQAGAHALFFPCGLGHMMGLDTHDMENLGEEYVGYTDTILKSTSFGLKSLRLGKALEAGFVITVEPGIYMIPELMDSWQAQKKFTDFINYDKLYAYRDFSGIRIEEDILVTPEGCRILGKSLPKTATAIEEMMNA